MSSYTTLQTTLKKQPRTWMISGVAGFIGSNLLETLLQLDQRVVGLDDFSTGHDANLVEVRSLVTARQWTRFRLVRGDICDLATCRRATKGVDVVLHQAALGSVPRSMEDPVANNRINVEGTLNMLVAGRDARIRRFVYASSSAVYGDDPGLPKREARLGAPLSPYAASKLMGEILAGVFSRAYDLETVGLRYFNVFGPRQDPNGPYAAVIPQWIAALLARKTVRINGDGRTTRDFCHVANVVQANLLAATTNNPRALNRAFNIAVGSRTTLNELFRLLEAELRRHRPKTRPQRPVHAAPRAGDVRHSEADIGQARRLLAFAPRHGVADGLRSAFAWYLKQASTKAAD